MADAQSTKPIRATTAEMGAALNEADAASQRAQENIEAALHAICLMLREPDSGALRMRIKTLCSSIEYYAFDSMNRINCIAEKFGAHYINENERAEERLIHAAVNREE